MIMPIHTRRAISIQAKLSSRAAGRAISVVGVRAQAKRGVVIQGQMGRSVL